MQLEFTTIFTSIYKRFFLASMLWLISWPVLYFIKLGEITGPKAWFWIIGELNFPVVAVVYIGMDTLLSRMGLKPWMTFTATVLLIAVCMPFYYERYGFALGVTIEARYL